MTRIVLPESLEIIGEDIFKNCNQLDFIYRTYNSIAQKLAEKEKKVFIDLERIQKEKIKPW